MLAVAELISGIIGVWLVPIPSVKAASGGIFLNGAYRIWNIVQDVTFENDVARYELEKITKSAQKTVNENCE